MRRKGQWLCTGSASFISLSAISTVIACSQIQTTEKFVTTDIGDLKGEFNPNSAQNEQLINYVAQIRQNGSKKQKTLLEAKTMLIIASGSIKDNAFNQSSWEAVSKFSQEVQNFNNAYYENKVYSHPNLFNAYDYAISKNFKFWILSGFQHQSAFEQWIQIGKNKQRFENNKTLVIAVDWFPAADSGSVLAELKGHILGLDFKTQDGAFIAAYATAQLLKEVNQATQALARQEQISTEQFPSEKTYFNTFGGGDFAGVTNFNYGFYEGMRQFNEDSLAAGNNYLVRTTTPIELTTGFGLTNDARAAIQRQLNNVHQPQVIFPVAGSLTGATIDEIKRKGQNQWVIGVDTNQALAFPADKANILTSVEKRVSVAVYKALLTVYGLNYDQKNNVKEASTLILKNGFHFNDDQLLVDQTGQLANFKFQGSFNDGFIRNSASTLNPNLKFIPQGQQEPITYAQRFDEIVNQKWIEFFGQANDVTSIGRLKTPIGQQTSDGKTGLKPSEKVINDFTQAMKDWTKWTANPEQFAQLAPQVIEANIKQVLALKNVAFGYMNNQNLKNYFEPILKLINEQKF